MFRSISHAFGHALKMSSVFCVRYYISLALLRVYAMNMLKRSRQVEPGVWELDATIEARTGTILKVFGQVRGTRAIHSPLGSLHRNESAFLVC